VLPERREAIAWALSHLEKTDMLLVAGKGHETYQEVNGIRYPFDDRKVVEEELEKLSGSCSDRAAAALEATCQDPVSSCMGGRS